MPDDYAARLRREDERRYRAEEKRKLKEGWRKQWVPPAGMSDDWSFTIQAETLPDKSGERVVGCYFPNPRFILTIEQAREVRDALDRALAGAEADSPA